MRAYMTTSFPEMNQPFPESDAYTNLGVSAAKADVEAAALSLNKGLVPTAFCRVMPDIYQRDPNFCVLAHSDGAGSKSILAYLKLQELGDLGGFTSIAHDALVMNLDDIACCGVTTGFTYVSIINRNVRRVGANVIQTIIEGTLRSIRSLRDTGIEIEFCGGETADVGDIVQTVLVDGAMSTRIRKGDIIQNNIRAGHIIVALSCHGDPATYETAWNSGIGSNGMTLARHSLLSSSVLMKYPEILGTSLQDSNGYYGPWGVNDILPGTNFTVLDALLSPTRSLAPVLHRFLSRCREEVSGIFHNTGGGQVKSLKVARGVHIKKTIPTPFPPIFAEIQRVTRLSDIEMAKVFNLGWRMEVYCSEKAADILIGIATEMGVEARKVGEVHRGEENKNALTVSIASEEVTFTS
jgi:phosphoribosylformylglycinamidine cyclo-ligase